MSKRFLFVITLLIAIIVCFVGCSNEVDPEPDMDNSLNIYLTLVNKTHQLPENWEELFQIDTVKNSLGEEVRIEHETYKHYQALRDELLEEGIQIELDSAYRSVDEQQELWDYFTKEYGEAYTKTYVAVPGYSEHHTGFAVDIFLIKDGEEIRENDDMIADREDFAKIHALLAKHGFILHYLENRDDVTGYSYEPWHLKYVGSPEISQNIVDSGLTLEEYLEKDKLN